MKKSKIFKTLSAFALLTTSVVVPTILSSCSTDNGNGNGNGSGGNNNGGNNNNGGSGGDNNNGGNNNGGSGDNGTDGDNNVSKITPKVNSRINFYGLDTELVDDSGDIKPLDDLFLQRINEYNTTKHNIFSDDLTDDQLNLIDVDINSSNSWNEGWNANNDYNNWYPTTSKVLKVKENLENKLTIESWKDLQNKLTPDLILEYVKNSNYNESYPTRGFKLVEGSKLKIIDGNINIHIANQGNLSKTYCLSIPLFNFTFAIKDVGLILSSKDNNKVNIDDSNKVNKVSLLFNIGINFKSNFENKTLWLKDYVDVKHNTSANIDIYDSPFSFSDTSQYPNDGFWAHGAINSLSSISNFLYNNQSKLGKWFGSTNYNQNFDNKEDFYNYFKFNILNNEYSESYFLSDNNKPLSGVISKNSDVLSKIPYKSQFRDIQLVKKTTDTKLFSTSGHISYGGGPLSKYLSFAYAKTAIYNYSKFFDLEDEYYWIDGTQGVKKINLGNYESPYAEKDNSLFNDGPTLITNATNDYYSIELDGEFVGKNFDEIKNMLDQKDGYEKLELLLDNSIGPFKHNNSGFEFDKSSLNKQGMEEIFNNTKNYYEYSYSSITNDNSAISITLNLQRGALAYPWCKQEIFVSGNATPGAEGKDETTIEKKFFPQENTYAMMPWDLGRYLKIQNQIPILYSSFKGKNGLYFPSTLYCYNAIYDATYFEKVSFTFKYIV